MVEGTNARIDFAEEIIAPGETAIFAGHRDDLFRPSRLKLRAKSSTSEGSRLWDCLVCGMFVGASPQMFGNALAAALFAEDGEHCGVTFETMAAGVCFRFRVKNTSSDPLAVSGWLEGVAVGEAWPERDIEPAESDALKAALAEMVPERPADDPLFTLVPFECAELAPNETKTIYSHRDRWVTYEARRLVVTVASGGEPNAEGVEITDCNCGNGHPEEAFMGPLAAFAPSSPSKGKVLVDRGRTPSLTIRNTTKTKVRVYATMLGSNWGEP